MITLDDLLADKSKEDWRTQLYSAAQGRGFVFNPDGAGTGTIALAGTPLGNYEVRLRILDVTGLVVDFEWSIDAGSNWTTAVTDGAGAYAFASLGVALQFLPTGYQPFVVGDLYVFALFSPTLPADSWQEGAVARTVVDIDAQVLEDLSAKGKGITKGGFIELAPGGWADLIAQNVYNEERIDAQTTVGNLVLVDAANAGLFNVGPGQLVAESDTGKRYTNVAGFLLALGGTVTTAFRASEPGADFNVAAGSITRLLTPLPGVTVSNPNPVGSSWITTQGRNQETNAELAVRCKQKWPSLGVGATDDGFRYWAKKASRNVTRAFTRVSPTVAGQVDLFLAGPGGAVDTDTVDAVVAYISRRVVLTSTAVVASAANRAVEVTGTVYVRSAFLAAAATQIAQNLEALSLGGKNNLGDVLAGVDIAGVLYAGEVIEQIQAATGVRNVDLDSLEFNGSAAADVDLDDGAAPEVLVLTADLTLVGV